MRCVRLAWLGVWLLGGGLAATAAPPNVVVILADDLGYSDIGCYGGEIETPNLDRLAAGGLRFTQGYNTARCWPSRAALLTGYYAQAVRRDALPDGTGGNGGTRPAWARLLPDLLAPAGYVSYHSGKWHIDGDPREQGFAHSLLVDAAAQSNYFTTEAVTEDGRPVPEAPDSYVTTMIGDHAVRCLRDHAATQAGTPFFHYVAFTAPHFPLQAPPALIAKYRERYRAGWDAVRQARAARLRSMKIATSPEAEPERDVGPPYQPKPDTLAQLGVGEVDRPLPWADLTAEQRELQAMKMAIHAAMVEAMDQEIGRILAALEAMNALDNTLILFASDNGASAEVMIRGEGHDPAAPPGSRKTFLCLGPGWSSCANTPFRRHKTWVHEGGVATPWIVHWPRGIQSRGALRTQPVHVIDVVPTVLELAGVTAPREHGGAPMPPLQGKSFARALVDPSTSPAHDVLWWCHERHRAVRVGDWKLVAARKTPWELYDLAVDRSETRNLAASEPARVKDLEATWNQIADECRAVAGDDQDEKAGGGDGPRGRRGKKAAVGSAEAGAATPNVVVIFCDDMGYGDPACYGGVASATPHIDRLAREGVRFTDFYVAQPVCSASRTALLTGCYPNRLGIHGALGPNDRHGLASAETTLAELLSARGYRTAAVGKWHLGHHPPFLPTRHGFDEWFGLPYSNDMWPHHPEAKPGTFPPLPLFENDTVIDADVTPEEQATLTARYAERAVSFIERAGVAADGRPFFLYLAHSMPHVPLFAGDNFRGRSPGGLYGDVLAEIDASVGAVLTALDRTGRAEDTLVIVTSDNGPWLSYGNHAGSAGGLREGKGTVFEGGVRVPCVARLPGVIPAGRVCAEPLMTIDLLPTIAAVTGQALATDAAGFCSVDGRRIDGHDRWPSFTGGGSPAERPEPTYFFWHGHGELQAVRSGPWKLFFPHTSRTMVGQPPGADGIPGRYRPLAVGRELYNLHEDSAETHDVAAAHPDVVARLEERAAAGRAELGDRLAGRTGVGVRQADTVAVAASDAVPEKARTKRPNIIYVITDDQGYGDIAAHGNPLVKTPNLDQMHGESVRLTEFHASPTCAPTRAALMTGRHEFRSGVTHTIFERERLALSATTLPQILKAAGYTTGIFGKWHLGDEDAYQPGKRGFDRVFIHGGGGIGQSFPGSCGDAPGNTYFDPVIRSDGKFVKTKGYCTDVFFDAALEWLDAKRHEDAPFFCYVATNAPHAPYDCPPGTDTAYCAALERIGIPKDAVKPSRNEIASFYAMIENIDTNIGRLLTKLDEWGLAEDTLVVFTTDNGTAAGGRVFNDGMRDQKGSPYRGGTRVPSLWRWKGSLPAGMDVPSLLAHIDVLPTLCDIAGVDIPPTVAASVEGRSFAPLLRGARIAWPDRPLVTHVGRWDRGKAAESAFRNCRIREGQWSLVNVKNRRDGWELYDISADPGEKTDVAKEHPDVVERLAATYDGWWQSVQKDLVNEDLDGPSENPFKTAYELQFGPPPKLSDVPRTSLWLAFPDDIAKPASPRFADFLAAPVCSVSQAQLLTGCYGVRVGVPGVYFPADHHGLHPAEFTIAERLAPLGYATACIGKWHLGRILDTLRERALDRNTLVVFTSDNGPWSGPVIEGRDISGLLFGTASGSPREAHYYFDGKALQAVRQGRWKLVIAPQTLGMGKQGGEVPASLAEPRLYDLEADIGEATDVAAAHPDVVARLLNLLARMRDELASQGPRGKRPAGTVAEPRTLDPSDPVEKRPRKTSAAPAVGTAPAARPNIVLFLADDLGYGELGCYGNAAAVTPNLDRFAAEGLRLTDCHSACPVCSPSRAALLTGRHPYRTGVFTWIPEGSPIHLRSSEITLPTLLRDAGCDTCHVGKWHLNGRFNSPEQPQPNDHGYAWWLATQNNAAPTHAFPENFVRNGEAIGKVDDYSAPFVAQEAVEWLTTKRDPAKPVFLAVWTHEPHYPIASAERYERLHAGIADPEERTYRANVTQLDDAFGTVMKALDDLGMADARSCSSRATTGPRGMA